MSVDKAQEKLNRERQKAAKDQAYTHLKTALAEFGDDPDEWQHAFFEQALSAFQK